MSNKRELIARIFPSGVPLSETINNNARFVHIRRQHFSSCAEFRTRDELYEAVARSTGGRPITYLEFGVWKGASIAKWASLNTEAESRFYGFDTFEGLPDDWEPGHPKGTFSTDGQMPQIEDHRVSFIKGLFQDTLRGFLKDTLLKHRLVINVDCDLYSATLFVLGTLDRHFDPGTVIILDDFYSMNHEFKAFHDYDASFGRHWRSIGKMPHCVKVAIEVEG